MAVSREVGTLVCRVRVGQDGRVKERTHPGEDEHAVTEADRHERALAERFTHGDEAGFREGFERYERVLRARASRALPAHLVRKVSVADVLQEVQIVAHRRRAGFTWRGPGSLGAWLLAIADLKVREIVRFHAGTAKRDVGREVDGLSGRGFVSRGPTPSQQAIARETQEQMRRARKQLSPAQQEVLSLVQEHGLTLGEVAGRIGRSRDAVKKIYGRGIVRFKQAFDEQREGGT